MRRVIGLVLTGLGTFLIVCAVLLPTWVSSQVIKFPLNEQETATLAASNASYFPIGTQKQTYDVFDTTLNQPEPFVYSGTTTVHGINAYEFVENVAPVQVGTQTLPGSLVGLSAASVTLPEYYQIHLIYYVDPDTGALIDVNEHQTTSLRNPATGAQSLLLFDADLIATPATVTNVVALDSSGRNELNLLETILPLVLGIVGAVALVAGILLARKPHQDIAAESAGTSPESAADAAPSTEHAAPSAGPLATEPHATERTGGVPANAAAEAPSETSAERSIVPGLDGEPPAR